MACYPCYPIILVLLYFVLGLFAGSRYKFQPSKILLKLVARVWKVTLWKLETQGVLTAVVSCVKTRAGYEHQTLENWNTAGPVHFSQNGKWDIWDNAKPDANLSFLSKAPVNTETHQNHGQKNVDFQLSVPWINPQLPCFIYAVSRWTKHLFRVNHPHFQVWSISLT